MLMGSSHSQGKKVDISAVSKGIQRLASVFVNIK